MSERKKQAPLVEKSCHGEFKETHPSYAMVSLSRWSSSGGRSFFGSPIEPHCGVSLTILRGEKVRSLSNTHYYGSSELISIDLTEAQFAQLITSFNIGNGVPCTLSEVRKASFKDLPDGLIPECDEKNERKIIEDEFKKNMEHAATEVAKLVKLAEELQTKPTINKADRKVFKDIAEHIKCIISSGAPFIQSQFNEAMDNVVFHAKADVDSFVSNLLRQAGMEAVQDKVKALYATLPGEQLKEIEAHTS